MAFKYAVIHSRIPGWADVGFVPAVTINCDPPYIAGKRDSTWTRITSDGLPALGDKAGWERKLGMRLLPIDPLV